MGILEVPMIHKSLTSSLHCKSVDFSHLKAAHLCVTKIITLLYCFDEFQAPLHLAARFAHSGRSLVQCSSLAVRNLHTASNECCKVVAMRLQVGPFSSRIQLSLLPCWLVCLKRKHGQSYDASHFSSACQLT